MMALTGDAQGEEMIGVVGTARQGNWIIEGNLG